MGRGSRDTRKRIRIALHREVAEIDIRVPRNKQRQLDKLVHHKDDIRTWGDEDFHEICEYMI